VDLHLELQGNRIWMACRLRGDIPDRAKEVVGWGWTDTKKAKTWGQEVVGNYVAGVWTFPMNFRTCLDLRAAFPDCNIVIHPNLKKWATAERDRRADLARIRNLESVPTPRIAKLYPRLDAAIHKRPFQSVGVEFAKRARYCVIGDQPGLGKTLEAVGAIIETDLRGPIVVAAPATAVVSTWPDEFDAWVPGEEYAVCEGDKEWRQKVLHDFWVWAKARPEERSWLFINLEMLQNDRPPVRKRKPKAMSDEDWAAVADEYEAEWEASMEEWDAEKRRHPELFDRMWSAVIIDESQRVLPAKSSLTKDQSQQRSGAQNLLVRPNGMKLALTGTPFRGNPLNHWGTLNWLWPQQWSGYWNYVDRWFNVTEDESGYGKVIESIRPEVERDYGTELDVTMIRRTKREVAPWMPEKQYPGVPLDPELPGSPVGVWIDMKGKQASAYQQMVDDAVADLESGQLMAAGLLAEMTRCKQMACAYGDVDHVLRQKPGTNYKEWVDKFRPMFPSNKWEWILEFLCERGITHKKSSWGEDKIIVASWQSPLLNLMRAEAESLGITSRIITGAVSGAERARAKQEFQSPKGPRLLFLNTIAGGVSLTLDNCDEMVILDQTWVPDDMEQLEDRIDRISRGEGRHPCTYWYLHSRGTIEAHIAASNLAKDSIQKRLMDGRRGVELATKLLTGG